MKSISEPFIKRPVMTVLLALSCALAGLYSYFSLPVSDLPNVDYPVITVRAFFPGMEPSMMAANVASPLEKEFMQISGLELVTSQSTQGSTTITVQFALNKNIDAAATDIQSAISRAVGSLPPDLPTPPMFEKSDPNSTPIHFMALTSNVLSKGELYDFASNEIANKISMLQGVSKCQVYGVSRAVRIEIDSNSLFNKGLTMSDVVSAVQRHTASLAAGTLNGSTNSLVIKPLGQLDKAIQYNDIIIDHRNGSPIYLKDIGEAVDGLASNDTRLVFWRADSTKEDSAVMIATTRAAGSNTIEVAKSIEKLIPTIQSQLPKSMNLIPSYDRSVRIIESINDVKETIIIAFILVILVIFIFLGRFTETIIPTVALPLSLFMTFIVMKLLNYSIDNLSLLAMTLAIGFLVDDAIVFLENMVRRMEVFGEKPTEAAINSGQEVSFTILAMTMSLIAVFIPMVFMGGQLGRVFREFSITIVVAIFSSGIVSLTVTPMMCARMLKSIHGKEKTYLENLAKKFENFILLYYGKSLNWALKRRYLSAIAWLVCIFLLYLSFSALPRTFLPAGDSGVLRGVFLTKEGTSPKQMHRYQDQISQVLENNPNLNQYICLSCLTGMLPSNQGMLIAFLKDGNRPKIQDIAAQLSKELFLIPGALTFLQPMPNLQINTGAMSTNQGKYAFIMTCQNPEELAVPMQRLMMEMMKHPGFSSVSSDLFLSNPELNIEILREQASMYGITTAQIEDTFKQSFSENRSYIIKTPIQQYNVIVAAKESQRADKSNVKDLFFRSKDGQMTPFDSVARMNETLGPISVNHINNFPSVTIFFNLHDWFPVGKATEFITSKAKEILPQQVLGSFQGEAATFKETTQSVINLLIVAVFVLYVILGILYESYIHPLTVLSALPIAMLGGLATLLFGGYELSLYGFIGLFMLLGIVGKNGIMMVDFAIARQKEGLSPTEAVHRASMERFRPIIMTTLAALMGMIPIAAGLGADGVSRMPLGLAVVGGLIFSQVVTLYMVPALYLCFEDLQTKVLDRIPFFTREI
ncbi:MAG: efflux RND transporter permease subunit [Puniceicoccales bacterium]|jgi:HAE1 family hydrophobic/amphiphilic exporter-1|nr:efflux RND transporter permease subunit [Puniceicoccales bacterium]